MLQCLRGYAAYRAAHPTNEDPEKISLENSVRKYLNSTRVSTLTRDQLDPLFKSLESFRSTKPQQDEEEAKLSREELMEVLNTLPTTQEEIYLIVKNTERRMGEEDVTALLDIVRVCVPPAPTS